MYASHNTYYCDVLTFCDVFLRFVMFTLWNYYILKLLHLETITFSDATLNDINVVLCYVLSQYHTIADGKFISRRAYHKYLIND
jgi:hypothetical protein